MALPRLFTLKDLRSYKDVVYDAVVMGEFDNDNPRRAMYKAGYDFGLTIHADIFEGDEE